jgi:hypothetical protein
MKNTRRNKKAGALMDILGPSFDNLSSNVSSTTSALGTEISNNASNLSRKVTDNAKDFGTKAKDFASSLWNKTKDITGMNSTTSYPPVVAPVVAPSAVPIQPVNPTYGGRKTRSRKMKKGGFGLRPLTLAEQVDQPIYSLANRVDQPINSLATSVASTFKGGKRTARKSKKSRKSRKTRKSRKSRR